MEKYGVEVDEKSATVAKTTGDCPKCKSKLDSTSPPHCTSCGTEPFEATLPEAQSSR